MALVAVPAGAQPAPAGMLSAGDAAAAPPPPVRDVGFDQKLGDPAPLDAPFRDETGRTVRLGEYFGNKPVVLHLVYYECPMLCGLSIEGLVRSLKALSLDVGRDFEVVTVSFNPREGPDLAAAKKESVLRQYGRPSAATGWHFLTGDETSIARLTKAVGFRYVWDKESRQYAHATGIVLLTPSGRIARYFFGIEYSAFNLRLGLLEASNGEIGTVTDRLLLLCFHYDPRMGRYSATVLGVVRGSAAATLVGLVAFLGFMLRRERAARGHPPGAA